MMRVRVSRQNLEPVLGPELNLALVPWLVPALVPLMASRAGSPHLIS